MCTQPDRFAQAVVDIRQILFPKRHGGEADAVATAKILAKREHLIATADFQENTVACRPSFYHFIHFIQIEHRFAIDFHDLVTFAESYFFGNALHFDFPGTVGRCGLFAFVGNK